MIADDASDAFSCNGKETSSHQAITYADDESFHQLIEDVRCTYASLNLTIIGSYNGLSPVRRQAIIWTNAGILLVGPVGTITVTS